MFGPIFRFINRNRCPHTATIYTSPARIMIESEDQCLYDKGHAGMHRDKNGNCWYTMDQTMKDRIEWGGLK